MSGHASAWLAAWNAPPRTAGSTQSRAKASRASTTCARSAPADAPAHVSLAFDGGMPVAINGVALALPELIDSLSLIAGQHGIAGGAPVHAPAADVLQAAYAALDGDTGEVRLRLLDGEHVVLAVSDRLSHLVMHA